MSTTVTDDDARLDALEQDLQSYRVSRDTWTLLVLAFGVFAALASIVGIGLALRAANDDDGAAAGEPVEADLSEFAIDMSTAEISTAGTLTVRNNGTMVHNLAVRGDGPGVRATSTPARAPSSTSASSSPARTSSTARSPVTPKPACRPN